tara:strand:- start:1067 stop:1402 length:336 start_codon:yes stop_codon:yes gene_type:complete
MSKVSFLQMVKNFSSEIKEYVKQGAPNVTKSQYTERVQECDACPHLEREHMRCGMCGCYVEHKAKWQTANCPDNRWEKIAVGNQGKKIEISGRKNDNSKTVNEAQSPNTED